MHHRHLIQAAVTMMLAAGLLSACANLPTLPNDAAAAATAQNPQAEMAYGWAQSGQNQ